MFDNLSEKLQEIINKTGRTALNQGNMQEALREIRMALLEADVNLRVVKAFISAIKDKAEGEKVLEGINPSQQLIKIVNDELIKILGEEQAPLNLSGYPSLIMMLGLQGSGKTTSSAKLAVKLKQEGKRPLLVACDVYRPAAISQLKALGQQIGVEVFSVKDLTDVRAIVQSAIDYSKSNGYNVLILDTAGRLQIDTEMMAELLIIDRVFAPQEKLLVIDAMTGQEAVNVAENFDAQIGITGLVLTKLDGDSRGGSALSVVYCTGKPIKLTGTGEKLNALENFYPDRMATRILGMGDIVSLVERAQEAFDEKAAKELQEKISKAEFTFNDFVKMQKQLKMFGSLEQIISMIPGVKMSKNEREQASHYGEQEIEKINAFIQSMTEEERNHPEILNTSRKKRIAKGCGLDMYHINLYIKKFEQMRSMMKGLNSMKKSFGSLETKINSHEITKAMSMMRRFK